MRAAAGPRGWQLGTALGQRAKPAPWILRPCPSARRAGPTRLEICRCDDSVRFCCFLVSYRPLARSSSTRVWATGLAAWASARAVDSKSSSPLPPLAARKPSRRRAAPPLRYKILGEVSRRAPIVNASGGAPRRGLAHIVARCPSRLNPRGAPGTRISKDGVPIFRRPPLSRCDAYRAPPAPSGRSP